MEPRFGESSVPTQTGKTVFVTGANTGIGFEAARIWAEAGARVILGCRTDEKLAHAQKRILDLHPQANVAGVPLELGRLASVRAAATRLCAEPSLDVVVNNAGVMIPPRTLTADGFESQLGVNHLGHFALVGLLLPKLIRRQGARVVTVSSLAHRAGRIHFDDLNAEKGYSKQARYAQSKLANLVFTYELQRRLERVGSPLKALACHPGGADTDLLRHLPSLLGSMLSLARGALNTASEGALPTVRAGVDRDAEGGDYFGPSGFAQFRGGAKKVRSSQQSQDPSLGERLWRVSVEMTGVDPFFG